MVGEAGNQISLGVLLLNIVPKPSLIIRASIAWGREYLPHGQETWV